MDRDRDRRDGDRGGSRIERSVDRRFVHTFSSHSILLHTTFLASCGGIAIDIIALDSRLNVDWAQLRLRLRRRILSRPTADRTGYGGA